MGGEFKSPVTFRWNGSLSAGQAYQVTTYHSESDHVIQSPLLSSSSWIVDLPAEKYGGWHWRVAVVQDGTTVTTSPEWMFWFNPHPSGGGGGGGGQSPLPTPEPGTS
jgi:hypothetical protein